jgi:hypothetical protein
MIHHILKETNNKVGSVTSNTQQHNIFLTMLSSTNKKGLDLAC